MRVFIADKFEQFGLDELKRIGCDVLYEPGKKGPDLVQALANAKADVLVVRSTKVTAETLDAVPGLSAVIRAGAGVDTIDVSAASSRGVLVANCPGMNAVAVAELTFALILCLDRRVPDAVAQLRAGQWNKAEFSKAAGLKGRSIGLIGLGPIGRAVAQRANAFEMTVLGWSRSLADGAPVLPGIRLCRSAHDVVAYSDVVSVHLASTPDTRGFCDKDFFEAMKPGAYFINTSRGDIVDADALANAIRKKGLRAGLDVYASEPAQAQAEFHDPLFGLDGVVYGTPHIAASTEQAQIAIAAETVRLIRVYNETGRVENCVNLSPASTSSRMLLVRHHNRPGVLAHVLGHISDAGINVEDMTNAILRDGQTAIARIHLAAAPKASLLEAIRKGNENVIAVSLVTPPTT